MISSPKDYYALKVVGDSMTEEGIFDGDTVVIKRQSSVENVKDREDCKLEPDTVI